MTRLDVSVYGRGVEETLYLAEVAEDAGFGRIWLGEHLVTPAASREGRVGTRGENRPEAAASGPASSGNPARPELFGAATQLHDPLVLLSAVAARTTRIGLGTAVYLLPLRAPVLAARAAATLQQISGSRLALGVGQGWLRQDFEAAGVPLGERSSRFTESIDVLRASWAGGAFSHSGRHWELGPMEVSRDPVHVPLILGGNGPRALRRAARSGDGWFCAGTPSVDDGLALVRQVRRDVERLRPGADRAAAFSVHIRIPELDPDAARTYADCGVDSVVVWADLLPHLTGVRTRDVAELVDAARALGFRRPDGDPEAMVRMFTKR